MNLYKWLRYNIIMTSKGVIFLFTLQKAAYSYRKDERH